MTAWLTPEMNAQMPTPRLLPGLRSSLGKYLGTFLGTYHQTQCQALACMREYQHEKLKAAIDSQLERMKSKACSKVIVKVNPWKFSMSSFKPTRERKHKRRARYVPEETRPSKKQKRYDHYVEKKLKQDEANDYLRKLEQQQQDAPKAQSSPKLADMVAGSGLAKPLATTADGLPVIPKRGQALAEAHDDDNWGGFSDDSDKEGEESSTFSDSDDDSNVQVRSGAFKSWAVGQLNRQLNHTPFYEESSVVDGKPIPPDESSRDNSTNPSTPDSSYVSTAIAQSADKPIKPAAGYRLGVVSNAAPEDQPRRVLHTVHVNRPSNLDRTLPILGREQEIMEAINNHHVVVIKAETGSGKTTQVPQFLYEHGYGSGNGPTPGMIAVTQPRRVAAVSMARRVAEELGDHGHKVAHQIRYDSTVSSQTAIKFMTDGILLRELSQDLLLKKYSAIIVDEAHERSVNTDLLIGLLSKIVPARLKKSAQNPNPQPLKLIIMSATLNIDDFLHDKLFPVTMRPFLVEAEGRQHQVTTHFALRSRTDYLEETIEKVKRAHRKLPRGGILVFLTGKQEIHFVLSRLRKELRTSTDHDTSNMPQMQLSAADTPLEPEDMDVGGGYGAKEHEQDITDDIDILTDEAELEKEFEISDDEADDVAPSTSATPQQPTTTKLARTKLNRDPYDTVHVLPLYSQLSSKDQLRVFEQPPERARLIVLATNVAETSLTIPNIRYVIDCGRSKERRYNFESNSYSFEIDYISKASAKQRAGRAGRTGPGHCWRLYSSAVFEQFFPEHTKPEILRTPVDAVVLQVKGLRYPLPISKFPFPSPPTENMLEQAELKLQMLGAIDGGSLGVLTDIGHQMAHFPLNDTRLSKMLVTAIQEYPHVIKEVIFLVAALSVDDIFDYHQIETEDAKVTHEAYARAQRFLGENDRQFDALTYIVAVQRYLESPQEYSKNCVRPKAMEQASAHVQQLTATIKKNCPELSERLSHTNLAGHRLEKAQINSIRSCIVAGFHDQIAIRCGKRTYSTLEHANEVFIQSRSLLARQDTGVLPKYVLYRSLLAERMLPLCGLSDQELAGALQKGHLSTLVRFGKPEKILDASGKGLMRDAWVRCELRLTPTNSWPLPPVKVRQRRNIPYSRGDWKTLRVLA